MAQIEEDAQEMMSQLILTKSSPAGCAGARAQGGRAPHDPDHRRAVVQRRRAEPLFDEIVAAEMSVRADGTYSGEMVRCRRPARREHRSSPTTATPRASSSRSASPTPTRRATCRCSRRSGSRSRSTPRPAWRRSPASGLAGRALVEGAGRPRPLLPIGPMMVERGTSEEHRCAPLQVRRSACQVRHGVRSPRPSPP